MCPDAALVKLVRIKPQKMAFEITYRLCSTYQIHAHSASCLGWKQTIQGRLVFKFKGAFTRLSNQRDKAVKMTHFFNLTQLQLVGMHQAFEVWCRQREKQIANLLPTYSSNHFQPSLLWCCTTTEQLPKPVLPSATLPRQCSEGTRGYGQTGLVCLGKRLYGNLIYATVCSLEERRAL